MTCQPVRRSCKRQILAQIKVRNAPLNLLSNRCPGEAQTERLSLCYHVLVLGRAESDEMGQSQAISVAC